SHSQIVALGGGECDIPNRGQTQLAGPRLHIAPIAADVQHVHKWQRRHFLYALFQGFPATLHVECGAVFFPGIADQATAKISNVLARRLGGEDREPALVLVDAERPLVKPVCNLGRAKLVALPQMVRYIRPHLRTHKTARARQKCHCFEKISSPHCVPPDVLSIWSGVSWYLMNHGWPPSRPDPIHHSS